MCTGITPATVKKSIGLHRLRVAASGAYAKASATACGARPAIAPLSGFLLPIAIGMCKNPSSPDTDGNLLLFRFASRAHPAKAGIGSAGPLAQIFNIETISSSRRV